MMVHFIGWLLTVFSIDKTDIKLPDNLVKTNKNGAKRLVQGPVLWFDLKIESIYMKE